jgi:hypothetical protein
MRRQMDKYKMNDVIFTGPRVLVIVKILYEVPGFGTMYRCQELYGYPHEFDYPEQFIDKCEVMRAEL